MSIFWWERKCSGCRSGTAKLEEEREIQHVWALSVCDISGLPLDVLSDCDNSDLPSDESGNLLNMVMDLVIRKTWCRWQTGKVWVSQCWNLLIFDCAVRLVTTWVFLAVSWCADGAIIKWWTALVATRAAKSLCSATKLVSAGYSIEVGPAQSVLRRSGGGCMLLQRCGERDFLSIRVTKSCEFCAITFSTMKREVQFLKSELRALLTGHLSTSKARLPWTLEEKHRHEVNGHAEYDNRCEICVKSSEISRHPRRMFSESCAFDYACHFQRI